MKNTNAKNDDELLNTVEILLEEDLENPEVEWLARDTLQQLKERGHELIDPDEDDGCLACLLIAQERSGFCRSGIFQCRRRGGR